VKYGETWQERQEPSALKNEASGQPARRALLVAVEVLVEPRAVAIEGTVAVRLGGAAARIGPQSAAAEFPPGLLVIACAILRQRIVSPTAAAKSVSGSAMGREEPYAVAFASISKPTSPTIVRMSSSRHISKISSSIRV
jgi:hypothetical protein